MRRFGLVIVALVVAACGGGGGTTVDPTPTATAVNVDAPKLPSSLWIMESIDGEPTPTEPPTKISFGLPDGFNGLQVSGLCKTLFGVYKLSGATLTAALELADAPEDCQGDAAAYREKIHAAVNGATGWVIDGTTLTLTGTNTIVLQRA